MQKQTYGGVYCFEESECTVAGRSTETTKEIFFFYCSSSYHLK